MYNIAINTCGSIGLPAYTGDFSRSINDWYLCSNIIVALSLLHSTLQDSDEFYEFYKWCIQQDINMGIPGVLYSCWHYQIFFILSTLWCFYACHCDFKISFSNKKKSLWLLVLGIILLGILVLCSTFKNWVAAILLQLYRIIYRFLRLCVNIMCLLEFFKYCLWMIRRPAELQQNNIIYKNKQKHKTPRSNWIKHKTFNLISPMVWIEHQEKFLQESNFKVYKFEAFSQP